MSEEADFNNAYRRGLLDGEMRALNDGVTRAHSRIDQHDRRLTAQERISYAVIGAMLAVQLLPVLADLLGK